MSASAHFRAMSKMLLLVTPAEESIELAPASGGVGLGRLLTG